MPKTLNLSIFEVMSRFLCLSFSTLLLFYGCRKESTTWDADYALPLIHTKLDIGNLLGDTNLLVNADSSLILSIQREIYRIDVDSFFETPDTTISQVHKLPTSATLSISPGYTFISETEESTYNIAGAELRYFKLKGGKLNYELISYVTGPTIDSIILPCATKGGIEFSEVIYVPTSDGITPAIAVGSVDLNDYEFDLTGTNSLKYNTLTSKASSTIDPAFSSNVTISQADSIRINVSFEDISPARALGYFGHELIEIPLDTVAIPFMDNIISGSLDIDQVQLDVTIKSGLGVDMQVNIEQLNSLNTSSMVALNHSTIGAPINLTRPTRTGWTVASEIHTESFSNSTSNLDEFLENLPKELSYSAQLQINPFGDVNSHGDFFDYEYPLLANINLEVPLCFAANNLTLQDTLNIEIEEDTTNIQNGSIIINATNNFPLSAEIKVFVLDENGLFTDPISTSTTIDPAVLNLANEVISSSTSQLILTVNKDQITRLIQTKQLLLNVVFNTANLPNMIKIMDWHNIDLNLNVILNYQHTIN